MNLLRIVGLGEPLIPHAVEHVAAHLKKILCPKTPVLAVCATKFHFKVEYEMPKNNKLFTETYKIKPTRTKLLRQIFSGSDQPLSHHHLFQPVHELQRRPVEPPPLAVLELLGEGANLGAFCNY